MATYRWSTLANGRVIDPFNAGSDVLRFDDLTISASAVQVQPNAGTGSTAFTYGGKTVTLHMLLPAATTVNVRFDNGSLLLVGDNTTATVNDSAGNVLVGAGGADQIIGLDGDDWLYGRGGNDRLDGGNGNDHLYGEQGGDVLNGAAGFDYARYDRGGSVTARLASAASNTGDASGDTYAAIEGLVGSQFDDTLGGDGNANDLQGGDGDDALFGLAGDDRLMGGGGDDQLDGGAGADTLNGGAGVDYARYDFAGAGVSASLSSPGGNSGEAAGDTYVSIEGLVGTAFQDTLRGNDSANDIQGAGGDDSLFGLGGGDTLQGAEGDDSLYGGAGADVIDGGAGFDYTRYDTAATGVTVDLAGDVANTGDAAGDDIFGIEGIVGSAFADALYGDDNANTLQGQDGDDALQGGAGDDNLQGGNGGDRLTGAEGADALDGGSGLDYAIYDAGLVSADLAVVGANTGDAAGDTYTSIEGLIGSMFDDVLRGDAAANQLVARDGDDTLTGRAGNDTLDAGSGDDMLDGGTGADALLGGTGFDYALYNAATAGVVASLAKPAQNAGEADGDSYLSIEGLIGSQFNDLLLADAGANDLQGLGGNDWLYGMSGNDVLTGGNGNDHLYGGAGADVLDGEAGYDYARYDTATAAVTIDLGGDVPSTGEAAGDELIFIEGVVGSAFGDQIFGDNNRNALQGRDGEDFLHGGAGNDILQGGNGNDQINGGEGADSLAGGAGNDTFVMSRSEVDGDTIADFSGNGAADGDILVFQGYGTPADGATFVQLDATRWRITSADAGAVQEIITFENGASLAASDYTFI